MTKTADPKRVVDIARTWLGTPYHDQASLKGVGCDCLGLARGIYHEIMGGETIQPPAYRRGWGETGRVEILAEGARKFLLEVDVAEPGCLLLFRMKRKAIAKHLGVLTFDQTLIHSYERSGVREELYTDAWQRRLAFVFVFLGGPV
jgi:NlpC/P60 family putative phage cell wall peptidase